MTPPARVPNTLDLAADPQLVHDFAETFNARVGHKRVKILQFVPAMRFHSVEDEAGMFAQLMHGDVSVITATLSTDMQLGLSPHSIFMTTAWVFRPAHSLPLVRIKLKVLRLSPREWCREPRVRFWSSAAKLYVVDWKLTRRDRPEAASP